MPPGYTDDGGDSTIWPSLWDCDCVGFPIIFPDWIGRPDENWTIDSDVVKWNWSLLRFVFEFNRSARLLQSVRFKSKISPHFKTKYFHSTFDESFWIFGSYLYFRLWKIVITTHDSFWKFLTAIKDSLITLLSGLFCHSNLKVKLVIMSYDINWSTKTSFLSTVIKTFNRLYQGGPGEIGHCALLYYVL